MVIDRIVGQDEKSQGNLHVYYENSNVHAENMTTYIQEIRTQQKKHVVTGEITDYEHTFYLNSSDSLTNLLAEDFKNKRVLTVTGSGEFSQIFALKGAKEIAAFDISPSAAYYAELRAISLQSHDFEKHKKFLNSWIPEKGVSNIEYTELVDQDIYKEIKHLLSLDAQAYFDALLSDPELSKCDIGTYYDGVHRFRTTKENNFNTLVGDIVTTENDYLNLQKSNEKPEITQLIWNAKDISELVKTYKPDTMYISNIFVNPKDILENTSSLLKMGTSEVIYSAWAGTFNTYAERKKHNLTLIDQEDSEAVGLHAGSKLLWLDDTSNSQIVLEVLQIDPKVDCGMLVKVVKSV